MLSRTLYVLRPGADKANESENTMVGTYISEDAFPDTIKDGGIKKLFQTYMNLSNSPNSSHPGDPDEKAFADLFTEDGLYELGPKNAKGRRSIIKMREALFSHIPMRHHRIIKYYTYGSNELEVVGHGIVDYEHHHGHKTGSEWAAKYSIKKVGEDKFLFSHVRIIVDTAAHS